MGNIHKVTPRKSFTLVANELIRNKQVSDGAFRLIAWIHSHDDGFNVSFAGISKGLGYGKDKIKSIIKNAESQEYLVRLKTRNEKTGTFDWDYYVFALPEECREFKSKIQLSTPGGDNPPMGNPPMGNPPMASPPPEDTPHIRIQNTENKNNKTNSKKTPPISPKGDLREGDADAVIEAEILEESQPEINATNNKTELTLDSHVAVNNSNNPVVEPTNSLVLTTSPARENDSQNDFISYAGRKNMENGREYLPWEGFLNNGRKKSGRGRGADIDPAFIAYVIKRNSWKPHFQNKKNQELYDATKVWIRNHLDDAFEFWDDFNSPQQEIPMPNITLKEAEREFKANQRRAKLDAWVARRQAK